MLLNYLYHKYLSIVKNVLMKRVVYYCIRICFAVDVIHEGSLIPICDGADASPYLLRRPRRSVFTFQPNNIDSFTKHTQLLCLYLHIRRI